MKLNILITKSLGSFLTIIFLPSDLMLITVLPGGIMSFSFSLIPLLFSFRFLLSMELEIIKFDISVNGETMLGLVIV